MPPEFLDALRTALRWVARSLTLDMQRLPAAPEPCHTRRELQPSSSNARHWLPLNYNSERGSHRTRPALTPTSHSTNAGDQIPVTHRSTGSPGIALHLHPCSASHSPSTTQISTNEPRQQRWRRERRRCTAPELCALVSTDRT